MSNKQTITAGAEAQQHFVAAQVNLFLFDLQNESAEHGFKSDSSWTLQITTESEMKQLKKLYKPVIALRLEPYVLISIFQQIKGRLQQQLSTADISLNANELETDSKNHLVAYQEKTVYR